jgi:uncharacterized surface protein with fasciclin (FAS1) repeats
MKYLLAATAMLGLLAGGLAPTFAANSSVESILASEADLSVFHQALVNTGVANELKQDTEYSIFAPTNAAFAAIQPSIYPCFYSAQCRAGVAAVLRNHIVPLNESIHSLSLWGGRPLPTIGSRSPFVEEAYKGDYTAEGHTVLRQVRSDEVSVYPIDGVIISEGELARFRVQPYASGPDMVTTKTVTTYTQEAPPAAPGGYPVP